MKRYELNGRFFWFEPDEAPAGAVEVKAKEPENKAENPANKSKKAKTK